MICQPTWWLYILKKTTTRYVYIRIIIMIIIWNRAKPWGKSPASDLHWHLGTLVLGIDQSVGWFQGLPWPNIPKYIQISTAGWWCNNHLEKYDFVNGKDCPIYEMENKKCSKPPTRQGFLGLSKDRDETSGESLGITTASGPVDCLNGLQKNRFWKATSQHERCFGFLQPCFFGTLPLYTQIPNSCQGESMRIGVPQNFSRLSPKP